MKKKIISILLVACFITMPIVANAEFDYSVLDEMEEEELKDLKAEIMTRLGIKFDYSELDEMTKGELIDLQDEIAIRLGDNDKSNAVELTLENYQKYLSVTCSNSLGGQMDVGTVAGLGKEVGSLVYTTIESALSVEGKSSNFNYEDVEVTVKISGYYVPLNYGIDSSEFEEYFLNNMNPIDFTLTVDTDISGNGKDSNVINLDNDCWIEKAGVSIDYEIVEIKGKVMPV